MHIDPSPLRFWCVRFLFLLAICLALHQAALANDAEVIVLLGKAEVREPGKSDWEAARLAQQLRAGTRVRTFEASQVGLLLRNRTQLQLAGGSELRLEAVDPSGDGTVLNLARGRMWTQIKQTVSGNLRLMTKLLQNADKSRMLRVLTPTMTLGIRGTDWETVVEGDGTSTVTVFSGAVDVSNDLGSLTVGPNERAVAAPNRAPVKILLSSAVDRVQWVTAYRPAPRRWAVPVAPALEPAVAAIEAGDYAQGQALLGIAAPSTGAVLLRADMALFLGRIDEAIAALQPLAASDPMAAALLARALVVAGRTGEARETLRAGIGSFLDHAEIALAWGDLERLDGDADAALKWYRQVAQTHPANAQAWFGVGRILAEKAHFAPARVALDEAIRLAPDAPGFQGERATLEALAGNTQAARAAFAQALAQQPDDYLALTGLGILQLGAGETEPALQSFLKASLIEPRFARAQLYIGVTYYQLGNRLRAMESLDLAARLDPKDPLPYLVLGLIHGDTLALRAAIDVARQAQLRMPYLKSLNQLQNNQRGSANVGAALAAQGMEEWAHAYAVDSYNPHWAGSALFLADRYPDGFNKNSELYRGFLLDPTVFGASNRFSALVGTPGHYGSAGLRLESGDVGQSIGQFTANGLTAGTVPLAYSLVADVASGQARPNTFQAHAGSTTLGLGARATPDLGLFYFGTRTKVGGHYSAPANPAAGSLTDDRLVQTIARQDLGVGHKLGPASEWMFKIGHGRQGTELDGALFHVPQTAELDQTFGAIPVLLPFAAAGRLDGYRTRIRQADAQLRHGFDLPSGVRIAWGLERGKETRELAYVRTFQSAVAPLFAAQLGSVAMRRFASTDLYLSTSWKPAPALDMQLDLVHQRLKSRVDLTDTLDLDGIGNLLSVPTREADDLSDINHRIGLSYAPAAGHKLRLVYQRWRHPASGGSLGPVDTLGVPVDDRLVEVGGLLRRTRIQYDWQRGDDAFLQAFFDRRRVDNLQSATTALFRVFGVEELNALRTRKPVFGEPFDELEDTPEFSAGVLTSLGVAGNWLLARDWTMAARYTASRSRNTGTGFAGNRVPFIPRHFVHIAAFWQAAPNWLVGLSSSYRSARFSDEANAAALAAGWVFGITSYWETDDKRWSIEAGLTNLHTNKKSAVERHARFIASATYRF